MVFWKSTPVNKRVPQLIRTPTNTEYSKLSNYVPPPGKPGPLKHYRRQLYSSAGFRSNKNHMRLDLINTPGGTTLNSSSTSTNPTCIHKLVDVIQRSPGPCVGVKDETKYNRCVGGTMNPKRVGSAEYDQTKYNTTKAYLQSRGKTIKTTECLVEKPSNNSFRQQGGVSSSSRIGRLKYITQTQNGACFQSARGAKLINKGQYNTHINQLSNTKINSTQKCREYISGTKNNCQ